jgi:hypothetical protein
MVECVVEEDSMDPVENAFKRRERKETRGVRDAVDDRETVTNDTPPVLFYF